MYIEIKIDYKEKDMIKYMREHYLEYFFHLDCKNEKEIYLIPKDKIQEIENIIFGECNV